jgi:hypothetical protein
MTEGPRKRSRPAGQGRAGYKSEPGKHLNESYQCSSPGTRQTPSSSRGKNRPIHMAEHSDRSVITCIGGLAHVVVVARPSACSVFVVRRALNLRVKFVGTYLTESKARKVAIETADTIGLDSLGRPGAWRMQRASAFQLATLKLRNIRHRSGITKGEAADQIALGIADAIDPH